MRYFISYPPAKYFKKIDIIAGTRIQEIIGMVQHEFGLSADIDSQAKTSIVFKYNGSDLKPTWSLTDLNVPPGAIIHCLYREKKFADLYVHCGFNNQILELFDDTITNETTIGEIRKKISDQIGVPLSTFCLQTYDNERRRLYDQMKLFQYNLRPNDHIYLKVWHDHEKFLNSCMKGFSKHYSHDNLTRDYQLQIALHVAAFYGFMDLGRSALQLGARSDCPVGEHPSRQWSSETIAQDMPELLKCPIHIAIERGHMKMVDLFVRQSLLCTQIIHPVSGFLPYRLALSCSILSKTKVEQQRYSQIYLYLYDKQFNLKISLNTNDSNVLTSNTNVSSLHRSSAHHAFFSLPRYCKIIRWYERAQERVWKKYGVHIDSSVKLKRVYQRKGLLGYKVLIDGFNNTFDASNQSICSVTSDKKSQTDQIDRYNSYTDEEREKIIQMKAYIKQFGANNQRRAKTATAITLQKSRHAPLLAQHGLFGAKVQPMNFAPINSSVILEDIVSSSDSSHSQGLSSFIEQDHQCAKFIANTGKSLNIDKTQSIAVNPTSLKSNENQHGFNRKANLMSKTEQFLKNSVQKSTTKTRPSSVQVNRSMMLNIDSGTSHPDHRKRRNLGPIQFHPDLKIRQATIKTYERCASASIHETAVHYLQEVDFLKRKSWLKQVEISQEMVKQHTKRLIQRGGDRKSNSILTPMRAINIMPSLCTTRLSTAKAN